MEISFYNTKRVIQGYSNVFWDKNLLAIFQTIMSEFLQNLIITDKIASFINDVIVGTKEEKRHDKLVNEIERMEENDLYTKPESYK